MARAATALLAAAGAGAAAASSWSDNFSAYDPALWVQSNDEIMHCTDGACFSARPDHLAYSPAGLTAELNRSPCNATASDCCIAGQCAQWAAGHLVSTALNLYGTFSWTARVGHAPGPPGQGPPPPNVFTCLTATFVDTPSHHEIATCFPSSNRSSIHYAYWYDATMHLVELPLPFDTSEAPHTFGVRWAPDGIDWTLDGAVRHSVRGTPNATIPHLPGNILLIVRPLTDAYSGDAELEV
jgi:hypothetical protein